jgi:hypothetical protein
MSKVRSVFIDGNHHGSVQLPARHSNEEERKPYTGVIDVNKSATRTVIDSEGPTAIHNAITGPDQAQRSASVRNSLDISARLDAMADNRKDHLNWRTSIVDLLKVLNLDSSL